MNLGQILAEVKLLVPPSTDVIDEQLVLKINQVQRRLYRELVLPDKMYTFTTDSTEKKYILPADCSEDRIKNLVVDGFDYPKVSTSEANPPERFCTVITDKLYIYPNPDNAVDAYLYYRPRYHDLIVTNLDDTPDVPEDYHELLVFGCAQWVASTQRDVDMVNNMQAEYDGLLQDAKRTFRQITSKRVTIKEVW